MKRRDVAELVGKTLKKIEKECPFRDDLLIFFTTDDEEYMMFHDQDCCEYVYLEDVVGELEDLIGSPILVAREDTNADDPGKLPDTDDSYTWTFYNIATAKGHVTLRWYGSSNGYYSESITFTKIKRYSTFKDAESARKELGEDYHIPVWGTEDTGYTIYF